MNIVIDEGLKAYIDPLTPDEHAALERSLLAEGCRDALVLWGDLLVDGHNRHGICMRHGLPFQTVQNTRFQSIEDVHLWMIDQHLGRRSVSDFQRGVLALRMKEIVAARARPAEAPAGTGPAAARAEPSPPPLATREDIARAARLSSHQVVMIERIRRQAAPEVVEAVRSGALSIHAAAAVATLPADEQAAAARGGKDELREAAKRVRESRRRAPAPAPAPRPVEAPADEVASLRWQVAALTAENDRLRQALAALQGA